MVRCIRPPQNPTKLEDHCFTVVVEYEKHSVAEYGNRFLLCQPCKVYYCDGFLCTAHWCQRHLLRNGTACTCLDIGDQDADSRAPPGLPVVTE
jgi:hypothetical protein